MISIKNLSKFYLPAVLLVSISISIWLAVNTYYINFWPTDSWNAYRPAGKVLFDHPYISQVHDAVGFKLIMRGKETLILAIALMQRLLHDFDSEYPAVLVLIAAMNVCSVLMFIIFKRLFNEATAFILFFLFVTSVWPYMYVLQAAHPPMVLMMFLLSIFFLQLANQRKLFYFLSGISLGFMFFSSPTSPIYLPYFLFFWIYQERKNNFSQILKNMFMQGLWTLGGMLIPFLYFTLPDPIAYFHKFQDFLNYSKKGNDFTIFRHLLEPQFNYPESFRGGGIVWVFKYMFLILPVLFPVYILGIFYLAFRSLKKPVYGLVILLSLSTLILVEFSQVAQFGRNYFSWLIGIFLIIGCATHDYLSAQKTSKIMFTSALIFVLFLHIGSNYAVFAQDIFPSRMATTKIYEWFLKNNIKQIYSYREHPLNKNILQFLVNPKIKPQLNLKPIESIVQVPDGYILVQPLTGKSVLNACADNDYNRDPFLTMLYTSGQFRKYVVQEFPTLSSSRLWAEEEEVCAYRDLMLGQITDVDRAKGKTWILDAKKIQQDFGAKIMENLKLKNSL